MNFIAKFLSKKAYGLWLNRFVKNSFNYSETRKIKLNYEILLSLVFIADNDEEKIYDLYKLFNNPFYNPEDSILLNRYFMDSAESLQKQIEQAEAKLHSIGINASGFLDPDAHWILVGLFGIIADPTKIILLDTLFRNIGCSHEDIITFIKGDILNEEVLDIAGYSPLDDPGEILESKKRVLNIVLEEKWLMPVYPQFLLYNTMKSN